VLVHGVNHGAWCWYKLKTLLEEVGYNVTAIDLAASGRNLEPLNNLRTIDDYHKPLYSYMATLAGEDRVIWLDIATVGAHYPLPCRGFLPKFLSPSLSQLS
jgi:hypothetical protein